MKKNLLRLLIFFTCLELNATEFKGSFKQGNLIIGKTDSKSIVYIDNKNIKVSKKGYFVFGIKKDRKSEIKIKIINNNKTKEIICDSENRWTSPKTSNPP
jgi:hypothetical protein